VQVFLFKKRPSQLSFCFLLKKGSSVTFISLYNHTLFAVLSASYSYFLKKNPTPPPSNVKTSCCFYVYPCCLLLLYYISPTTLPLHDGRPALLQPLTKSSPPHQRKSCPENDFFLHFFLSGEGNPGIFVIFIFNFTTVIFFFYGWLHSGPG
jgi:hypothetical protein